MKTTHTYSGITYKKIPRKTACAMCAVGADVWLETVLNLENGYFNPCLARWQHMEYPEIFVFFLPELP